MAETVIPTIVISEDVLALDRNSDEWRNLTMKVREACETSGCFFLDYAKIPLQLQQDFFSETKDMFDVPMEKKMGCVKPMPLDGGYAASNPFVPLYESFGIPSDGGRDAVRDTEKLLWPEGKPGFSEAINSTIAKMLELNLLLLKMIFDSYGIGGYYESNEIEKNVKANLRMIKYRLPKENEEPIALPTHVDRVILTVLFQTSVQGLQALIKDDGEWVDFTCPKGHLVFVVGEALQVWSNGRLEALKHRVMMTGDQERYTCGLFTKLKNGVTIEVPRELVDDDHPLRYKPFVFSDYAYKCLSDMRSDALEDHAPNQLDGVEEAC